METSSEPSSSVPGVVSSSHNSRRRRNPAVLIQWVEEHPHNPYPTKAEKTYLAFYAGMSHRQLNDWFANARRNIKKIGYEAWRRKHTGFSAILSGIQLQRHSGAPSSAVGVISPADSSSVTPSCLPLSPSPSQVAVGPEAEAAATPSAETMSYQPNVRPFQGPFALWSIPAGPNHIRGPLSSGFPCKYRHYQSPGVQQLGLYETAAAVPWSSEQAAQPFWGMSLAMQPEPAASYYGRIAHEGPMVPGRSQPPEF